MKRILGVAMGMVLACGGPAARAATLVWDADTAGGSAQDGSGVWNGTNTNWFDGAVNTNWSDANPDSAIIGAGNGAAGVITNSGTRTVGGITFSPAGSGSYAITGGTLALSNNPTLTMNASATVGSQLGGNSGFTQSGAGTLTISGAGHPILGPISVKGGTLLLTGTLGVLGGNGVFVGGNTVQINAGATGVLNNIWQTGEGTTNALSFDVNGGTLSFFNNDNYASRVTLTAGKIITSGGSRPWRTGNFRSGLITVNASAATSTISGSLCFVGTASASNTTFDVADGSAANDLEVSATIFDHPGFEGKMALVKSGAGTMFLSGLNTFTGGSVINSGRVVAGASSASAGVFGGFNASPSALVIQNGATVDINGRANGADFFYGVTIAGSGTSGQGALINNGANGTSNNRQTPNITLSTNATIGGRGDIYMVNGGHAADTLNMGGYVLTKTGTNTFFFDNTSVVSGGTIVVNQGGISQINASSATGTAFSLANSNGVLLTLANLPLSIGSLTGGGTLGGNVNLGSGTLTVGGDNSSPSAFSGVISGSGGLIKTGTGTQTLAAANTFTGNVTVNAGTLRSAAGNLGSITALGQNNTVTVNTGAALDVSGANGTGNQIGASQLNTISVNGGTLNFSLTGGSPQDGPYMGVINLNGAAVTTTTNSGPRWGYNQASGVINATNAPSIWSAPLWLVNQSGKSLTVNAVTNLTMSGPVADYPSLTGLPFIKTGAGVLTLTATNTYNGTTTISNGTLVIGIGGSISNSAVIAIGSSGIFDISATGHTLGNGKAIQGFGSVTGNLMTVAGAKIIPGAGASAGTLTMNGDVMMNAGTTNYFDLTGSTNIGGSVNDLLVVNGNFEPSNSVIALNLMTPLTNGTYRLVTYSGAKNSSFNPAIFGGSGSPRQTVILDELTTPGAVNLVVSGKVANLTWNSQSSATWDVGVSTNWFNPDIATNDVFYTPDAVVFDDTPGVVTSILLLTNVAPSSLTVSSSTNSFTFSGSGKITGIAGVVKNGTNALTMAVNATNDFTGPVVINEGTLIVAGTSLQPLALSTVSNSATLAFNRTAAFTFGNAIGGPGSVLQSGPGVLTLSGANTYTGGTVVSIGTLQQPNASAVGRGPITLGDANTGTNNVAWLFAGSTQPSNAIIVANIGSGSATLGTYSGGLGTAHNAPVSLNRPVTISDATGDRTTFNGPISGNPGTIAITGTRVTFGNGTNTFVGNVVVNPGSVFQMDNAAAVPVTTAVTNNGTFYLNIGNGNTAFIGVLSGAGNVQVHPSVSGTQTLSLGGDNGSGLYGGTIRNGGGVVAIAKAGTGTLILTGSNTYSGATTINNGMLQIGNGGTNGSLGSGAVLDNATLVFNRSDAITNAYAISGAGVVVQAGASSLTVVGTNMAHGGGTFVSNGTLVANGAIGTGPVGISSGAVMIANNALGGGTISVAAGAMLIGTGTVAGAVSSDGYVGVGGGSIGTLTVGGYTAGLGTLHLRIDGAIGAGIDYDQFNITGNATLGGELSVTITNGYAPTTNDYFFVMQSSGFISGTFATTNLPALGAGLEWSVLYAGSFVLLQPVSVALPPTAYDAWSNLHVLAQGPTGDDDNDGFANLLEYVTGGNPTNNDTAALMDASYNGGLLSLKFTRDTNSIDATLIVEGGYSSTNDASWTGIATNINGSWGAATNVSETGTSNPVNVTVQDTDPLATNRFLRLRVTRP